MGDNKVWKDLEKHLYNSKVEGYGNVQKESINPNQESIILDPNWTPPVQLEQKVHTGYFQ